MHRSIAKTALITGASSGIGKVLAEEFARDGYNLVLAARNVAALHLLAQDLHRRDHIEATVIAADLQTDGGAATLHAPVQARTITLSAWVNNAGYGGFDEFKDSALAPQRGQRVVVPGFTNRPMALSVRVTPRNLGTRLVKKMSQPVHA